MKNSNYKLPELIEAHGGKGILRSIHVPMQEEIRAKTGKSLDVYQAYETLALYTENFGLVDAEAIKADNMLAELIVRQLEVKEAPASSSDAMPTMEEFENALIGLEALLEDEPGNEDLIATIEGIKAMVE